MLASQEVYCMNPGKHLLVVTHRRPTSLLLPGQRNCAGSDLGCACDSGGWGEICRIFEDRGSCASSGCPHAKMHGAACQTCVSLPMASPVLASGHKDE